MKTKREKLTTLTIWSLVLRATFYFSLLAPLILSCGRLEDLDVLRRNPIGDNVSYVQAGEVITLNSENYSFISSKIALPVNLVQKVSLSDTIIGEIDTKLVAEYNREFSEDNPELPIDAFGVANAGLFIVDEGSDVATDSLYVTLLKGNVLAPNTPYLVPVRLTSLKGNKMKQSVHFFKVIVRFNTLYAYPTGASIVNGVRPSRVAGGPMSLLYINSFADSVKIQVSLNRPFFVNETFVEASLLSNAQIDSIARARRFNLVPFPNDTYTLEKGLVTIPATSRLSTDSLTLKFRNRSTFTRGRTYMLALKLKHYAQSKYGVPPIANDSSTVWVRFVL